MERLTIDEAIEKYKCIVNTDDNCPRYCMRPCDECVQECGQIAKWLEELKAIKSDGFTDDLLNMGFTKGYNRALDDFVQKVKEHQYVLCDVINSKDYGMFTIGIEQIAEELKEGRNNDASVCY